MTVITLLVLVVTLLPISFYFFLKQRFQYWEKRNVPHLKASSIFGNFSEFILFKKHHGQLTQSLCKKFPNAPYFGVYYGTEPALIIQDPELIKLVTTKDFYYFSGREITKFHHKELFSRNIFFYDGDKWKVVRQNLTPLFSTAKMKNMFPLIQNCSQIFETVLDQETKSSNVLEVRSVMARFTMDCIGSCAFGVDTNTLIQKTNNIFFDIGNVIFDIQSYSAFKAVARALWPAIFYGLGFKTFPKQVENFFYELLNGIFKGRQYTPSSRNDFVDLMLKLRNNETMIGDSISNSGEKVSFEVNDELLLSHCFAFFAAGYETSATTLSFTMYELAKNPEAQEKVFEEVEAYLRRHNNVLKYDCVSEMPYLEACFHEALRLYPVLGVITREVSEDYTLPSGQKLKKGLRVHLPAYHLHHNPEHFPEPEVYRPERFLGKEKRNIKPYTYLPFGEGQRLCIGMRFAKMQMISGMIVVLKKYRVELADGMKTELALEPRAPIIQPVGLIHLKFIEREGWEQRTLQSPEVS